MRVTRYLTGTLLIAGMAAYAWSPRAAAEPISGSATAFAAQQDQTAPPKQKETKPPKKTKTAKPSKTEHTQTKADQTEKAEPRQTNAHQPERADQHQQKEEKAQPQHAQKGRNQSSGAHGRIADKDYQAHFGRPHSFTVRRVVTTTRIVPNQTQFVYSGYTFVFLDPWPPEWALTDDCYIEYEDGQYVLIDLSHPGMTIALQIAG